MEDFNENDLEFEEFEESSETKDIQKEDLVMIEIMPKIDFQELEGNLMNKLLSQNIDNKLFQDSFTKGSNNKEPFTNFISDFYMNCEIKNSTKLRTYIKNKKVLTNDLCIKEIQSDEIYTFSKDFENLKRKKANKKTFYDEVDNSLIKKLQIKYIEIKNNYLENKNYRFEDLFKMNQSKENNLLTFQENSNYAKAPGKIFNDSEKPNNNQSNIFTNHSPELNHSRNFICDEKLMKQSNSAITDQHISI